MGKAKAMKVEKKYVKKQGPGKGQGPGKRQSPEKGPPKPKGILKRPSTLALPNRNDPGLSLEEKMEQFAKKTMGTPKSFWIASVPLRERLSGEGLPGQGSPSKTRT